MDSRLVHIQVRGPSVLTDHWCRCSELDTMHRIISIKRAALLKLLGRLFIKIPALFVAWLIQVARLECIDSIQHGHCLADSFRQVNCQGPCGSCINHSATSIFHASHNLPRYGTAWPETIRSLPDHPDCRETMDFPLAR